MRGRRAGIGSLKTLTFQDMDGVAVTLCASKPSDTWPVPQHSHTRAFSLSPHFSLSNLVFFRDTQITFCKDDCNYGSSSDDQAEGSCVHVQDHVTQSADRTPKGVTQPPRVIWRRSPVTREWRFTGNPEKQDGGAATGARLGLCVSVLSMGHNAWHLPCEGVKV